MIIYNSILIGSTRVLLLILLTTLFQFVFISANAQHDHTDNTAVTNHLLACRSGVNFINNLPAPEIMNGVGKSSLKIKTTSELTQKYFSQGVSLLHCFWDFEAYRSFKEAIKHDSSAIMPYWGLLHTIKFIDNEEFDEDEKFALKKIKVLVDSVDGFEQLYAKGIISAIETDKNDEYEKYLEYIVHQYPKDVDAKLFLALYKMSGYDKDMNPREGTIYSEYLLRDLLVSNPDNHGVRHYWIHQMENCCPEEALESADVLAAMAPESGHIVHMPGHIYYKMGNYKKAHDQFVSAMKVDSAYMSNQKITELDNWNYIHNLNYLMANCAQDGRYKEGLNYANRLERMVTAADRTDQHRGTYFFQGKITPAIMEMRFGRWGEAIKKFDAIIDPDTLYGKAAIDYKNAFSLFSHGMLALEKKNVESAKIYLDRLDALFWRNSQLEEKKQQYGFYRQMILKVASQELEGNILLVSKEYDKAIVMLEMAAKMEKELGYTEPPYYPRPVLLSLANAYIVNKEFDKAEECYIKLLEKHPNSSMAYWGLMKLYKVNKENDKYSAVKIKFDAVTQYGNREVFR